MVQSLGVVGKPGPDAGGVGFVLASDASLPAYKTAASGQIA